MANILPFATRDERDQQPLTEPSAPLTELELYHVLIEHSYVKLNSLITFYKSTGKWNDTADRLMRRVLDDTNAVCAAVSGAKTVNGEAHTASQVPGSSPATGIPLTLNIDPNLSGTANLSATTSTPRRSLFAPRNDGKRHDDGGGFDRHQ